MKPTEYQYWVEVSETIEKYFRKGNACPVSNIVSLKWLDMKSNMVRLSNNDTNYYERFIAGQWYEKAIWGLDSKEDFDAVITAIEEYSKFLKDVNQIDEKDKKEENGGKYSLKQAIYIIENIYRENEENHFNELIPSWHQALQDSLKVLQTAEPSRAIADYIDDCNYLFENMPLLQLHLINFLISK